MIVQFLSNVHFCPSFEVQLNCISWHSIVYFKDFTWPKIIRVKQANSFSTTEIWRERNDWYCLVRYKSDNNHLQENPSAVRDSMMRFKNSESLDFNSNLFCIYVLLDWQTNKLMMFAWFFDSRNNRIELFKLALSKAYHWFFILNWNSVKTHGQIVINSYKTAYQFLIIKNLLFGRNKFDIWKAALFEGGKTFNAYTLNRTKKWCDLISFLVFSKVRLMYRFDWRWMFVTILIC